MLDITEPYRAFCIDQAVAEVGTKISDELSEVEGKNAKEVERKQARIYMKYFGKDLSVTKQMFKTPTPTK